MANDIAAGYLGMEVSVPAHVVHRRFAAETVVLNLESGKYHGLNAVAGRMLEALEASDTVGGAAAQIASEFDHPLDEVEADISALCESLVDRGLIELR